MPQMYKVFFNNNTLILAKQVPENVHFDIIYPYTKKKELLTFIFGTCVQITNKNICIYFNDIEKLWKKFSGLFKVKTAGGGIVVNQQNQYLFIKRRGLWDLPKGHQEKGEIIEDTAIREVCEECNLTALTIKKPLLITYHTYWLKDKPILKPTHWYLMIYSGNTSGTPQLEEDITEIRWCKKSDLKEIKTNTFPSILDVIYSVHELSGV